ncbi:SH3 and PX domain-containing protein 2B-like isoform 2-T2 [Discoglossus pictus]
MERLRLLGSHCQALLQTDPKISQSEDIIQFFSPNYQDLTPSFPENSLVVMPSEKEEVQMSRTDGQWSPQLVTRPVISQSYVCIATYEATDTKNRPFNVKKDETIDVLIKDTSGWWLVENLERRLAWFPAPFLVNPHSEDKSVSESLDKGTLYYAVKGYAAQCADELSLSIGIIVDVIEKSNTGWWRIWYNGKSGFVPSMFLKPYKNPHQKLHVPFSQDRFGSTPDLHKAVGNLGGNKEFDTIKTPQESEQGRGRRLLDRRRSHSLSNFADISDPLFKDSLLTQRNRSSRDVVYESDQFNEDYKSTPSPQKAQIPKVQPFSEDAYHMSMEKTIRITNPEERQPRKNSGFDDPCLCGAYKPWTSSPITDPTPPLVPPRPSSLEIYTKCTTITREAAQTAHLQPNM